MLGRRCTRQILVGLTGLRSCQSLWKGKSAHNGENLQSEPQPYGIPDALSHKARTYYRAHYTSGAANSSRGEEDVGSVQRDQSINWNHLDLYLQLLSRGNVGQDGTKK